jgi:LAO/AO transport system kinase
MVDTFVLLLAPAGGDELQGIKRGIMELADLVVVTKADGALEPAAKATASDYTNALHLVRPKTEAWHARVLTCSATVPSGIDEVWAAIDAHREALTASGDLERHRSEQAREWMWAEIGEGLMERLRAHRGASEAAERLEVEVAEGRLPAPVAAARVLDELGA